jgi:ubiquinone/menaquinone biosynthesis C-methylase UbiE
LNLPKSANILNLGCGNSEFSEKLYDDGFINNYNIDICPNVIKYMNERKQNRPGLIYETMDVRKLTYSDEMFDLVVDKSTIDALLCGEQSFMNVASMTKEISRVLKTGGYYFIISYGKPENRVFHLERDHLDFDINIYSIKKQEEDGDEDEQIHYGYMCKKLDNANKKLVNFDLVYKELEREEIEEEEEEEGDYDNESEEIKDD